MPNAKVLSEKQAIVAELTEKIQKASAGVLVDYKGITVAEDTALRAECRKNELDYAVVKNTLVRFAINNVGIVNFFPVESVRPEDWKRVIDVNLFGTFLCAQAAAKVMIAQNKPGTIVNMASMSARIINTPQTTSSYCTSKAAVVHLTRSLAVELAKYNIRVNCVSPGYVATEVVTDWSDELQGWIDRTPQKRMGTPEDIAGAYLYLASDASRYATGTELLIDGGYTAI